MHSTQPKAQIKRLYKEEELLCSLPVLLVWELERGCIGFQSRRYWSWWAIIYFCPSVSSSQPIRLSSLLYGLSWVQTPFKCSAHRQSNQMKGWMLLVPSLFFISSPPPPSPPPNDPAEVWFSAWQKATQKQYVTNYNSGTRDSVLDCLVPSPSDIHYTVCSPTGQWGRKLIYFSKQFVRSDGVAITRIQISQNSILFVSLINAVS